MATMMPGVAAAMNGGTQQGQEPTKPEPWQSEESKYFTTQIPGLQPGDVEKLIRIVTDYRASWAQDRLERIRQWMENVFYWKGVQCIKWDTSTNAWYDVLAWARSNQQESGEDTDLERWINPITLMFANVFVGTMSRAVPKAVIKPVNADPSLKDSVTAKAAVDAIRIIDRKNKKRKMNRSIYEMLYLFGSYFRYTRATVDANLWGYDEQPVFEDMEIQMPARFKCPQCSTETPITDPAQTDGMACPSCNSFMGQESYFAAGEGNRMSLQMTGVKRVPRAGVKQSLHSPLEIDMDPKAKGERPLRQTGTFSYEVEIDIGEGRRLFSKAYDAIAQGAVSGTSVNASVEQLARLDAVSALGGATADNSLMNPTFGRHWMNPMAFDQPGDRDFSARMNKLFPDGCMLSMIGDVPVDLRAANLEKEWSSCSLYENQGVYCAALANIAVSFNARFNRTMWILDDWMSRAALGLNVGDASRIDTEKMAGKPMPAGTMIGIPMKINGEFRPIEELFAHFDLPLNPALLQYPQMLLTFAEVIIGIPRQLGGQGTQDDVETLGGQQLQLNRAASALKPYFENVQDEDAQACQNAFGCLQELMRTGQVTKIWDVIESRGGAFQNNEVDWSALQGNVTFDVDEDQELPISPDELRTAIQTMFKELSSNNPAAAEWFAVPANADLALSTMLPGTVRASEAQEMKTKSDLQIIKEQGLQPKLNPDGSQGMELPVKPEKWEDFQVAKRVVSRELAEHFELRIENPMAWEAINAYYDALDEMDMQVAQQAANRQMQVNQAGQPPKQGPTPAEQTMQQEFAELMQQAGPAIIRLAQIAQMDPAMTKGTANAQVSAAKEIVDATTKGADLMTKK